MIWAWLEAEAYQQRRCHDVDRIMKLSNLPKIPNWVRVDIFCCLEKEAMKQFYSESLLRKDPELSLLEKAPQLKRAITLNANDEVNPTLQTLMSQILTQGNSYSGAAEQFSQEALERSKEAGKAGII